MTHSRDTLLERIKALEADKKKLADEADEKISKTKVEWDKEVAEKEAEKKSEIQELIQRHDEQLAQRKSFYEMETEKRE